MLYHITNYVDELRFLAQKMAPWLMLGPVFTKFFNAIYSYNNLCNELLVLKSFRNYSEIK